MHVHVKDGATARKSTTGSDGQPRKTRVDHPAEVAALACVRRGRPGEALNIVMTAYDSAIRGFILRVIRSREAADDLCQQVFLDVFHGIGKFQERSSLWSWLCRIAYHRCLDELRRTQRESAIDDFDVLNALVGQPDPIVDADRIGERRALEKCLGKLPPVIRSQVLMRAFFGLSYEEIAEAVDTPAGTVQVRMSRILPRLRRCLRDEGVAR